MGIIKLEDVKNSSGWKYLSENCPKVFEKYATKFLNMAKPFVNSVIFDDNKDFRDKEGEVIHYESNSSGSKKVVFSYTSKIKNRDLDCQFKEFKKIEFSLNDENNLVINELSGRLESKYGHSFDESNDEILKTHYSCQVYTPEGVELMYRGYSDIFNLNQEDLNKDMDLRSIVCDEYNPHLEQYRDGKVSVNGFYGKSPVLFEQMRTVDNLGLVKVVSSSFDKNGEPVNKKEEFCFNTFIGAKDNIDPFSIFVNRGLDPLAFISNGKLMVNYKEAGTSINNYAEVAKTRFGMELRNKLKTLMDSNKKMSSMESDLLRKYEFLFNTLGTNKWIWKDIPDNKRSKKI